jgi:hypothetical protein
MRKLQEINDPKSCLNKGPDDRLKFTLDGNDLAGPDTIRFWCKKRIALGKNTKYDPQIIEALECAEAMERERE